MREKKIQCKIFKLQFQLLGYENISVLDGGLHKWEKDGYPVSSGDEKPKVNLLHVF